MLQFHEHSPDTPIADLNYIGTNELNLLGVVGDRSDTHDTAIITTVIEIVREYKS